MTATLHEAPISLIDSYDVNTAEPISRKNIEDRIEYIKETSNDPAEQLMGLTALTHDTQEMPAILIDELEDTVEMVLDAIDDKNNKLDESVLGLGEVVAFVDAAHVTGKSAIAEKALKVVQGDETYIKFPIDTHAAVQISTENDLTFNEGLSIARKERGSRDMPFTVDQNRQMQEPSVENSPLGSDYDDLFSSKERTPRAS